MDNIRNKYIETFFSKLSDEDKKNIYFDQYLWHAFSYEKVSCLKEKEAIEAFNEISENNVYIFFQRSKKILEKENLTYEKLLHMIDNEEDFDVDCYIVDKNFKWTFVFTHETIIWNATPTGASYCYYIGPFFTTIDMIKKI